MSSGDAAVSAGGLGTAFRRLRDPVLLLAVPVAFVVLDGMFGHGSVDIGFDFRGTLWEPARALLDGVPMYPEPTRAAVEIGNPAVYPPFVILVATPFALVSASVAAWIWLFVLGFCVLAALWVLGVRDWRCIVLALSSPVVVQGLFWGNLTVALVLLVALAWRYRDRALVAGLAVGAGVAAKLFVWPLIAWLLATRRYRAAGWAAGSGVTLVVGSWALVGFDGMRDYPALLREVQNVYAVRSDSVAAVVGGFGARLSIAVACCWLVGVTLTAFAVWLARRDDGDRRAFAIVVTAAIVASPIVWPNYAALLFVPIAVTWPRLHPVWFFGYAIWLSGLLPKPTATGATGRPADVPQMVWDLSHAAPAPGKALAIVVTILVVAATLGRATERRVS